MARRRHVVDTSVRDRLIAAERTILRYAEMVGATDTIAKTRRRIDDLTEGRPVIVHHGWEIGLPLDTAGRWRLEGDGTITAISEWTRRDV